MSRSLGHTFTHGSFDETAAREALSDEGFVVACGASLDLLGTCFLAAPDTREFLDAYGVVRTSVMDGDWPFGGGADFNGAQQMFVSDDGAQSIKADFARMFRGPAHLEAAPWGSVYMDRDQVMYGWTWVELRSWMHAHGIVGAYAENDPEDNFGRLLHLGAALARARDAALCELLADHLLCWAPRFLTAVEESAKTGAYRGLARLCSATFDDLCGILGIVAAERRMYR